MTTARRRLTSLAPDPGWVLSAEGDTLLASAGADRVFAIPDLEPATVAEITALWHDWDDRHAGAPSAQGRRVLDELAAVGALRPAAQPGPARVALVWSGPEATAVTDRLAAGGRVRTDGASVLVVVRSGGALRMAAALARDTSLPHLLVDCAYARTVSLGPAVYPGDSACLDCFAERLERRWGDPETPRHPAVLANTDIIAGFIAAEAERVHRGTSSLVGRTAAYDLESHRIVAGTVHRMPGCLRCDPGDAAAGLWEQTR